MKKTAIIIVIASISFIGCGEQKLTDTENAEIAAAQLKIATANLAGGDREKPVDELIRIAKKKPCAKYEGDTMREVLQEEASDMQPYDASTADRIDRQLDELPKCQ
jgi:hypothetical protein